GQGRQRRTLTIDPFEQVEDWFNAISYAVTRPIVDSGRIGARGSSFSGGHVVYVAAHDPRIRTIVSQVGSLDSRSKSGAIQAEDTITQSNAYASALTTGHASYPDAGSTSVGKLIGTPVGNKLLRWAPLEVAHRVTQPTLFITAEHEELFSNSDNADAAYKRVSGPKSLKMLTDISHYGVYGTKRSEALTMTLNWFDKYLKALSGEPGLR
ncbi:alpha/beta hydrolase, partial [Hyphomonas oceanitis]|uniref:alpha/beta hydrolase n=1 Tax=Hyphomonas oceanitis TaxID=81033 RepID=UPI0012EC95FB